MMRRDRFILVHGLHRLEACKALGEEKRDELTVVVEVEELPARGVGSGLFLSVCSPVQEPSTISSGHTAEPEIGGTILKIRIGIQWD